jgi:large subunit ribosomal protein L22
VVGKAVLRFAKISPAKMRQVASLIKGKDANEALSMLQFTNKKGAGILEKVLKSAIANTLQKESSISEDSLFVKEVKIDDGPRWRRMRFSARGGASVLRKRTSHVTVVVENRPRPKEDKKKKRTTVK